MGNELREEVADWGGGMFIYLFIYL